jgi:site-specific recombinase XerD
MPLEFGKATALQQAMPITRLLAGDSSVHPHSLRHAYATHLLAVGEN